MLVEEDGIDLPPQMVRQARREPDDGRGIQAEAIEGEIARHALRGDFKQNRDLPAHPIRQGLRAARVHRFHIASVP